ncbi:Spastin [Galdieria sulphuraria]|nr:Spastin [Galdieria sulphuraria]
MRRLKTEFLIQFDGLNTTGEDRIFVMAATNRPWDLDEAMELHEKLLSFLCCRKENFSYSDLAALTREAALCPIRELGPKIVRIQENRIRPLRKDDFVEALKTIRPSVCEEQLSKYIEWNESFGVTAK